MGLFQLRAQAKVEDEGEVVAAGDVRRDVGLHHIEALQQRTVRQLLVCVYVRVCLSACVYGIPRISRTT